MSNWFKQLINKKKNHGAAVLGVSILPQGAAWCVLDNGGDRPVLKQSAVQSGAYKTPSEALLALHQHSPLPTLPCHISLSHHFYNMLLVDSPNVPGAELREAVKWRVKDLITQPIEKMVVDVFQLPEDAYRGRMNMLYAALIEKQLVTDLIATCERLNLNLQEIGIAELAIAAVGRSIPDAENLGMAVLHLTGDDGSINLIENGFLYLTRTLEMNAMGGYSGSLDFNQNQDPTDNLALDIQRSLDYYESQLGKSGVNRLYVVTESAEQQLWCDSLSARLPIKAQPFALDTCVETHEALDTLQQGLLAPAVGIAMGADHAGG